jgi:hypothetical protein
MPKKKNKINTPSDPTGKNTIEIENSVNPATEKQNLNTELRMPKGAIRPQSTFK